MQQVPYFTHYMIAIVNNCLHAMELSQQMKTRNGTKSVDQTNALTISNSFENLRQTYEVDSFILFDRQINIAFYLSLEKKKHRVLGQKLLDFY